MEPFIRIANKNDSSAIASLVNAAYRPGTNKSGWTHESEIVDGDRISIEQVNALFSEISLLFVAVEDKKIIACVHLAIEGDSGHIGMLATDPEIQAKGWGKLMLENAESYAMDKCAVKRFEMVVISQRTELVSFYLRRGYKRTGNVEAYPMSANVGVPKSTELTVERLVKYA